MTSEMAEKEAVAMGTRYVPAGTEENQDSSHTGQVRTECLRKINQPCHS